MAKVVHQGLPVVGCLREKKHQVCVDYFCVFIVPQAHTVTTGEGICENVGNWGHFLMIIMCF